MIIKLRNLGRSKTPFGRTLRGLGENTVLNFNKVDVLRVS